MRRSGLGLIMLLAVMLLVAWLTMSQMGALHQTPSTGNETEQSADPVEQAQDAVDAINEMQQSAGEIEE